MGFLRRLQQANCTRLLEIGAGTGQDSVFFASHGLDVVATDMSAAMVAGGLFFFGVYGDSKGTEEGPAESDDHVPARFFSWRTDDQIVRFASESFDIVDFHIAQTDTEYRFQSLTLRRPIRS